MLINTGRQKGLLRFTWRSIRPWRVYFISSRKIVIIRNRPEGKILIHRVFPITATVIMGLIRRVLRITGVSWGIWVLEHQTMLKRNRPVQMGSFEGLWRVHQNKRVRHPGSCWQLYHWTLQERVWFFQKVESHKGKTLQT